MSRFRWQQLSLLDLFSAVLPKAAPKILRPSAGVRERPLKLSPASSFSSNRFEELCRGAYAGIQIVTETRMRKGWKLEWRRGGTARLLLSKPLQQAPDEVLRALLDWALLAQKRRTDAQTQSVRRKLEHEIHAWIEAHPEADPKSLLQASRRAVRYLQRLQPNGKHHDLESILTAINAEYFGGELKARITWSSRWGGLSTQSSRKGADGKPYALITISRGYDHPSATPEIVGGVVYHECLHIVLPPQVGSGRRVVHGREFRRREKEYGHYEIWRRWHRDALPRIIRRGP